MNIIAITSSFFLRALQSLLYDHVLVEIVTRVVPYTLTSGKIEVVDILCWCLTGKETLLYKFELQRTDRFVFFILDLNYPFPP